MTTAGSARGASPAPGQRKAAGPKVERTGGLRAPGLPRPSLQSKGWRLTLVAAAVALLVGWLVWYALTPEELPVSDRTVNASGVAGTPLYVGMFTAPDDFERTLRMSGVKVHATTNTELAVTPLLCRRGTIGVTTQPDQFCSELVNPEGERLTAGDAIVLEIDSADPALAVIDRVRISYREDIRWDTQEAGNKQAVVTVAGRPDAG